jgi:hypothetical protein
VELTPSADPKGTWTMTAPNLDFVTERIATGGDLPYSDHRDLPVLAAWARLGITHVIDNRVEWNDEAHVAGHAPQVTYLHNGVDDAGGRQPDRWYDEGVAFAQAALADPDAKVLIHCHMGINRGPSLTYALLLDLGWDPVEAIAAIRAARPIAAVGYAEDALGWFHRTYGVRPVQRIDDHLRLAAWREANWIDVARIIRQQRIAERDGSAA